jgi:hypothetical protein
LLHQAEPGFINEGRWLERVSRTLLAHVPVRQFKQFLVHERRQFLQNGVLSATPLFEEQRYRMGIRQHGGFSLLDRI